MQHKEWFSTWFDTKYYALLYQNRNDDEASQFVDNIVKTVKPNKNAKVLDMGSGSGRFSRFLNNKGFEVTGFDISPSVIRKAVISSPGNITYELHDIREPFKENYFDYVFSFFTSFGYFDTDEEHLQTIKNVYDSLKIHGVFLLDYLNSDRESINLPQKQELKISGINYSIHKYKKDNFFMKDITIEDYGKTYHFTEKVRTYTLRDFKNMFTKVGLQLIACYGDYELNNFDILKSKRLIMLAVKR